jgi:hypothetical protein
MRGWMILFAVLAASGITLGRAGSGSDTAAFVGVVFGFLFVVSLFAKLIRTRV